MIEKNLGDINFDRKTIIHIQMDEFCFLQNNQNMADNLIGFFTEGIASCSVLIIYNDNDDFVPY